MITPAMDMNEVMTNPIFWAFTSPLGLIIIKRFILGVKKSDAEIAKSNTDIAAAESYKKVIDLLTEKIDQLHHDNVELCNTVKDMANERQDLVARVTHLESIITGLRSDLSRSGAIPPQTSGA